MKQSEGWDLSRLHSYLSARVQDFGQIVDLAKFEGGQSNPTYKLRTTNTDYVLRTKPGRRADLLPSAHAIDREYRIMGALRGAGIPVPSTILYCDNEEIIGREFYVMEFVTGRIFWDQSLPSLTSSERTAVYAEMNRVLAALHSLDFAAIGLADFGRPGNYFERQIARWSKQYRASETERISAFDRLIAWLPENIPPEEETSIVHGDYRLDNLVFHPNEPKIIGILDWELATLGHPLADFSYHCLGYRIAPHQFRGIASLNLAQLSIPSESEYIQAYCKNSGRVAIDNWEYYMAYNLFRLAAILQGIAKRAIDGTAASSRATEVGGQARVLAELGWEAAERAMAE